jgi:hypothetical protein
MKKDCKRARRSDFESGRLQEKKKKCIKASRELCAILM